MSALVPLPYYHDNFQYSCQTFFSKDDKKTHFIIYRSMSGKVLLTRTEFEDSIYPIVHLWIVYPHHTLVCAFTWCACTGDFSQQHSDFFTRAIFMADIVCESIEEYHVQIEFKALVSPVFFKTLIHFSLSTACILNQQSCFYNVPLEQCPFDVQKSIESTKAHAKLLDSELFTLQSLKAFPKDESFESLHFFSMVIQEREEKEVFLAALKILTCTQCVFDWKTTNASFYTYLSCTSYIYFLYIGSAWKEKLDNFVLQAKQFLIATGFATQELHEVATIVDCQNAFFLTIMDDYRKWLYELGAPLTGLFLGYNDQDCESLFEFILNYAAQENVEFVQHQLWVAPPKMQCISYFKQQGIQLLTPSLDSSLYFFSDNIGKYQSVRGFFQKHPYFSQPNNSVVVFKHALQYCEKLESIVPLLYSVQTHREEVFNLVLEMLSSAVQKPHDEETDDADSSFLMCNTIQTLWSQQEALLQSKLPAHVFFSIHDFVTKGDNSSLTKLYSLAN